MTLAQHGKYFAMSGVRNVTKETQHRFEPLLDEHGKQVVRPVKKGEWFVGPQMVIVKAFKDSKTAYPIFRRVPHEDTSCEVAFARMAQANYQNPHWFSAMSDPSFYDLVCKFCEGERSPELTAAMVALTEKMKGST
jgi:hypothetical protein